MQGMRMSTVFYQVILVSFLSSMLNLQTCIYTTADSHIPHSADEIGLASHLTLENNIRMRDQRNDASSYQHRYDDDDGDDGDDGDSGDDVEDMYMSCDHADNTYTHNQLYPSTHTGLKPNRPNQCVMCVCIDGDTICHLKTCTNITCPADQVVYMEDDCCPQCIDLHLQQQQQQQHQQQQGNNTDTQHPQHHTVAPGVVDVPFVVDAPELTPYEGAALGCYAGEHIYPEGSQWHPIINPFGRMDCIICTCSNGFINCDRVICPRESSLPCARPVRRRGQCCKTCHSPTDLPQHGGSLSASVLRACPTSAGNVLVLQSSTKGHVRLVFENLVSDRITVMTWSTRRGRVVDYAEDSMISVQAKHLFGGSNFQYSIIGATTNRRMERFSQKVHRQLAKCESRCKRRVILRQQRRLKLKRVKYKTIC